MFIYRFQYDYFFENAPMPVITDTPDYHAISSPELQTNLLLDNVAKIERMYFNFFFHSFTLTVGICLLTLTFLFYWLSNQRAS